MSEESAAVWYSSADGLSLFARRFEKPSRRTPLLCLHDVAQTSRVFLALARKLSDKRRVLIPDLRGHGRSDYALDPSTYTIAQTATDAVQLLDIEEVHTAVVMGCGVGGMIALELAARYPERIGAIVLCEAGPNLSPEKIKQDLRRTELAATLGSWAQAEQALPNAQLILRDEAGRPAPDWDPLAPPQLIENLCSVSGWELFEQVKNKPMLVLKGASSPSLSVDCVDAMTTKKPDLKCVTIEATADARRLDLPEIERAIEIFLATAS